ncbi:hypothetical protein Nepgr_007218 [Nepenthes gracilis]|uniref:Receptor-like serine/threonine-protein kinase n=1 Tax=Nepenthes gracilis TaxID=150966 RepID=A0AAD3S6M5_NEPGR|nr:hypothetical protein Nepgr_007218 [Nepenthes gracilis]
MEVPTTLLNSHLIFSSFLFFTFHPFFSMALDTLTATESLSINQTLVSAGQTFELGFFSGSSQEKSYVGIWYKNLLPRTIVWVANRDAPVRSSSATLKLGDQSKIVILDQNSSIVWSSSQSQASNPVIQLLDTGNLVVREELDESSGKYIWQSFDHPTDTFLPGQKLGWNLTTGVNLYLTSWTSVDDPSSGPFTFKIDPHGDPEFYLWNGDSKIIYVSGPWIGHRFSGVPEMKSSTSFNFSFLANEDEIYYTFELLNNSVKSRLMVDASGVLNRYAWVPDSNVWNLFWYAPKDQCDNYSECGSFGICNTSALFVCQCMQGFEPKNQQAWALRDGSDGCKRTTKLECEGDGFLQLQNMKVPQSSGAFVNRSMITADCKALCLKNCNCSAYADSDFVNGVGSGCVIWTGDLIDMRSYVQGGQNLYIRLAASDLVGNTTFGNGSNNTKRVVMGVSIALGLAVLVIAGCFVWKRKTLQTICKGKLKKKVSRAGVTERSQDFLLSGAVQSSQRGFSVEVNAEDLELPLFDFDTIAKATDNFSDKNKLGQGGFGRVYKGVLVEGRELAVKRLSKESGQGSEEFKNEVKSIAKLQHRNLVRLLGCCVEREEKMLIYEYLQNKSLDRIIFNKERSKILNWESRFNIICGIARGLMYLHQDSIIRIIHRDLKASNILLDAEMNPKISDFGMARIFGGDETESNNTRRVVGTYGYMSPEYAMDGIFSAKSDVFSFGVLVLEIVTGKKNQGFFNSNDDLNLLGYAWKMWTEGKGTELLDPSIGCAYSKHQVLRCIEVGLLSVQERPEDRPTMSAIVLMLSSESTSLPRPKPPGFCLKSHPAETNSSSRQDESFTVNQVTVTTLEAR